MTCADVPAVSGSNEDSAVFAVINSHHRTMVHDVQVTVLQSVQGLIQQK